MKRIASLSVIAVMLVTLNQSCKKASADTVTTQTIDASVSMNQTLQLNLGSAGNKQSISVNSQALHAEVSQVSKSSGKAIYTYTPATSYFGTDQVVIKSVNDSTHDCTPGSKVTTLTTVNITVVK